METYYLLVHVVLYGYQLDIKSVPVCETYSGCFIRIY